MTVAEAARRLEVTPSLVYRLCRRGMLPHARVGVGRGAIRISEADLAAFLGRRRVGFAEERAPAPPGTPAIPDLIGRWRAEKAARGARRP
jgi:excisionase family DNA binding protein